MSLANANRYGFRRSLPFNFGVLVGFGIVLLGCCYLDLILVSLLPKIQYGLEILAAAYMAFLAYKVATTKPATAEDTVRTSAAFSTGLLLQFINPKCILYGITVMSSFILPIYQSHITLLSFTLLLAVIGFIATCCWSLFGALFQRYLEKYQRPFNITMAVLLLYCAVSVFI